MVDRHVLIASASCLLLVSGCSTPQGTGFQDPGAQQDPTVPIAIADPLTESLTLYLGGRSFQEDLDPADNHTLVGIEYATQAPGSAVGWEFGLSYSEKVLSGFDFSLFGSTSLDASSLEFYGGARKTFNQAGAFRPYIGGGLSAMTVDLDVSSPISESDSETVLGLYAHAGVAYSFNQFFALGLDYRILVADDATLFGIETDVDYTQLALTLGFRF